LRGAHWLVCWTVEATYRQTDRQDETDIETETEAWRNRQRGSWFTSSPGRKFVSKFLFCLCPGVYYKYSDLHTVGDRIWWWGWGL